jgi:hypothetical protein
MNVQNRTPYLSVNHLEVHNFDLGNDAIQSIQKIVDDKLENNVVSQSGLTASRIIIGGDVNRDVLSSGISATGGLHDSLTVPGTLSVVGKITVNSSSDNSFSLPVTKGTSNQILYTDGAGNTSWMTIPFFSQTQIQPGENMTLDVSGDIYILNTVSSPSFTDLTATGTVNLGVTTVSKLNGFTVPTGSGLTGTFLYTSASDVSSWSSWALPASATLTTGKMLIATSPTAMDLTAYTMPTSAGTAGKFWQSDGANMIASVFTLPTGKGTNGQFLSTDGAGTTSWTTVNATTVSQGTNITVTPSGSDYSVAVVASPTFTDLTVTKLNGFTVPTSSGLTGTFLYTSASDVSSWSSWALPASATLTTGKMLIATSATAMDLTAYTMPTTAGSTGKFWQSDGTNMIASTFTLPSGNGTNGQLLSTDGVGTTSWTTLDASIFAVGCLPLVIKPLGYTTKSLPGPPFNNTFTTYYQSYQGSTLESFQFSLATTLAFGSGNVDYTIKRVTGPVKVNFNSKLTNWLSNGGGAYPSGARMRLQHINMSNVTVDLFTITKSDVSSDTWYTDDPAHASPSINLSTTFTGSDILRVILDGAGNTTISVNVYSMTIY